MTHGNASANGSSNAHAKGSASGKAIDVEKLAVSPNLPAQIPALLEQLNADGNEYLSTDPQARLKLLETARSLVYALETPREAIIRHCWSEVRISLSQGLYPVYILAPVKKS